MKPQSITDAWVYLSASPLLGLTVTLLAYQAAVWVYRRSGQRAWANPVLIAIVLITLFLTATGTPYKRYFEGAQFVHFLLGPATVALAVPLFVNLRRIRQLLWPTLLTLLIGGVVATLLGVALAWAFGAEQMILMTMAPKSVTSPIAMLVAEQIGGVAALAAVFVLITGVLGAMCGPELLRRIGVHHPAAQGMALGLTAHAVGTARALQEHEESGAFAALAMSLMGVATAVFLPLVVALLV